jgi:hypothetical protein
MLLAEGRVDAMVEPELSLWDVAALIPIVTEAGGTFTDSDGRPGRAAAARSPRTAPARRPAGPAAAEGGSDRLVYVAGGPGWFFLAAMIAAYGVANLLQSAAAARTTVHHTFDPGCCCAWPASVPTCSGLLCQVLGFVLRLPGPARSAAVPGAGQRGRRARGDRACSAY